MYKAGVCYLLQAVWYVEAPNQSGNVFGSLDKWRGLAVIFDSFDNDNKKNNPSISLLVNDGTISFDHASYEYSSSIFYFKAYIIFLKHGFLFVSLFFV